MRSLAFQPVTQEPSDLIIYPDYLVNCPALMVSGPLKKMQLDRSDSVRKTLALTLSLSPRRGDSLSPRWEVPPNGDSFRCARQFLPLPGVTAIEISPVARPHGQAPNLGLARPEAR